MVENFFELGIIALTSAVKYIPAFIFGTLKDIGAVNLALSMGIGGFLGVTVYAFFGAELRKLIEKIRSRKVRPHPTISRIRRIRKLIDFWNKFGIYGIAFLTPPLISPPIGTAIALAFGEKPSRVILYLGVSCLIWGWIFALLAEPINKILALVAQ